MATMYKHVHITGPLGGPCSA